MQKSKTQAINISKNLLKSVTNQSNNDTQVNKIFKTYISKHILPLTKLTKTKIFSETGNEEEENDICNLTS